MGFWARLFRRWFRPDAAGAENQSHALFVHIPLASEFGEDQERADLFELQEEIMRILKVADAGELDGDEWGGHECVLFMYGPDAGRMLDAVRPILDVRRLPAGSYAIQRFGGLDCEDEERIALG